MRHGIGIAVFGVLALLVAGCSDKEGAEATPSPTVEDSPAPSETVGGTGTPEATATPGELPELPEGLQEVMERVAEVRELEPPPGLKAELVARPDLPGLLDTLLTDEDRQLMAETTTLYRLLGHFREDQDYLSIYRSFGAESILGLYSPVHDTLWVVYDGEEPTFDSLSPSEEATLAHEFVHALQDYHFDLDGTYDRVGHEMDRGLAWTAVVEGDASVHEEEYSDRYLARIGAGRVFAFGVLPQVPDVPLSFIRELLFPYTTGALWVESLVRSEGVEYVNELLVEPPAGTVCVLHKERCLDGFEPVAVQLPDIAGALGDGWSRESGGTLGEFHLGNFLDLELGLTAALAAADGWVGDRYDVYVSGEDSAAVLMVELADEGEAEEFLAALTQVVEGQGGTWEGSTRREARTEDGREFVMQELDGDRVLVAIGSTDGIGSGAFAVLQEGTP